jgi:hypothetical protein
MILREKCLSFLQEPNPVYESALTKLLVEKKWGKLMTQQGLSSDSYSIARFISRDPQQSQPKIRQLFDYDDIATQPAIEFPLAGKLPIFYSISGLSPLTSSEVSELDGEEKVKRALGILKMIPELYKPVGMLVRTIQLLKTHDEEIDISHSDPNIPFSIFVSVGGNEGPIYDIRLCESILHEAMHLKLTLIEEEVDLILPGTREQYYSPWRDEERPVRGVLHGLFVFKAIQCFYHEALSLFGDKPYINRFLIERVEDISKEIKVVKELYTSNGFTSEGAQFAKSLTISGN